MAGYVRFAALGDSATVGLGDPVVGGWRGWAALLAEALGMSHDVSFCNLAVVGATAGDVRRGQLGAAVAHRPDLASLVVGLNDTLRSTWSADAFRHDVLTCAEALDGTGATLLTARFHDHGAVLGLPAVLRRPLARRIDQVNLVYDELHARYGGARVDLAARPEVFDRTFWSVDRLHPSERGHRLFAHGFAAEVTALGLEVPPPSLVSHGATTGWDDLRWMVTRAAPWVGTRTRDLAPWAVRAALSEVTGHRARRIEATTPLGD